jgi:hypothetical protein
MAGYPTDQRGSYFRQFWDAGYHIPPSREIEALVNKWKEDHDVSSVEELKQEEKEMIIYRHSRIFLQELEFMYKRLKVSSNFQGRNLEHKDKERILFEIAKLMKKIESNYPNAFRGVSDDVMTAFTPFIKKMVVKDCLKESHFDIPPIHQWNGRLGKNSKASKAQLVLVIRGDLIKRYPNAIIYAVDGYQPDSATPKYIIPALGENLRDHFKGEGLDEDGTTEKVTNILEEHPKIYPLFGTQVLPDITFLGFPFDESSAKSLHEPPGKFFVIEEHISEPRFGLDEKASPPALHDWNDLSWAHFNLVEGNYIDFPAAASDTNLEQGKWDEWIDFSSADRASKTLQKPVRIVIHADDMLPR